MTFRVDDRFHHSDPVLRIPKQHRLAAIGLWTLTGAWSSQFEKDGWVPDHIVLEYGTHVIAGRLVTVGLWKKRRGGYQFVDWARWQETREEAEDRRRFWREKKARQRESARESESRASVPGDTQGELAIHHPYPLTDRQTEDPSSGGTSRPRTQAPDDGLGYPQAGDGVVDDDPSIRSGLDLDAIATRLNTRTGLPADRFQAAEAGRHYLGKSKRPGAIRRVTAYVVTSIGREDQHVLENFIHTGRWSA